MSDSAKAEETKMYLGILPDWKSHEWLVRRIAHDFVQDMYSRNRGWSRSPIRRVEQTLRISGLRGTSSSIRVGHGWRDLNDRETAERYQRHEEVKLRSSAAKCLRQWLKKQFPDRLRLPAGFQGAIESEVVVQMLVQAARALQAPRVPSLREQEGLSAFGRETYRNDYADRAMPCARRRLYQRLPHSGGVAEEASLQILQYRLKSVLVDGVPLSPNDARLIVAKDGDAERLFRCWGLGRGGAWVLQRVIMPQREVNNVAVTLEEATEFMQKQEMSVQQIARVCFAKKPFDFDFEVMEKEGREE